jgi:peptidase M41-like protein
LNPRQQDFWGQGIAGWQPRRYGEATAAAIDAAVKDLIDKAFGRAVWILERNRALLDRSAKELLIKETFSKEDLQQLRRSVIPDLNQGTSAGIGRAAAVSLGDKPMNNQSTTSGSRLIDCRGSEAVDGI